ncbi:MAG: hypothetical protein R2843_05790 [Thermomicrobiales bacterium]
MPASALGIEPRALKIEDGHYVDVEQMVLDVKNVDYQISPAGTRPTRRHDRGRLTQEFSDSSSQKAPASNWRTPGLSFR